MMRSLLLLSAILCLFGCKEKVEQPAVPALNLNGTPYAHTENILSFGPRPTGSQGAREVRAYVQSVLEEAGWKVGMQTFNARTPLGNKTFTNVIARFPTSAESDVWKQPVTGLLCAHLDSKYFRNKHFLAADDAASACGLILTLAQDLAQTPEQASGLELIFFDGEEAFGKDMGPTQSGIFDGIYGSTAYAGRWRGVQNKPRFGILLDMIGHHDLSIQVPVDSPPQLLAAMNRAAQAAGQSERFGVSPGQILDDHVPLNNAGIPTIDIIGDFSKTNWWHTPRDNLKLISKESLAISHEVVTGMLKELLQE